MWIYLVILGLVGSVLGDTTPINSCFNGAPQPLHAFVGDCTQPPCGLAQGSSFAIRAVFEIPRLTTRLETRAVAYLGGILPIQYPLGANAETCRSLTNTYCPVQEGEVVRYELNFPIEDWMPVGTSVTVEFNIVDLDANQSVACMRLGIRVDPPLDSRVANATIV